MGLFNRKKKEAEEAAKKAAELAESQAKAEAARLKLAKEAAEKEAAKAKAEAEALKDKLEAETEAEEKKEKLLEMRERADDLREKRAEEAEAKKKEREEEKLAAATIKHVWTNEDTYAKLAFKYYGSIKKPFYMLIYEHNKHIIGDNMNSIKTGTEIEIPPLPKELEDQK